jgi:O-antigen/teichoic acid export membrane protein
VIRAIERAVRERPFVRAVAALQSGSLLLTGVGFVSSVALARILGPAGYGLYSWTMSTGTTIGLLRRLGQDYCATTRVAEGSAVGDVARVRSGLAFYVCVSVWTSIVVLPLAMFAAWWLGAVDPAWTERSLLLMLYLVSGFWAVLAGVTVIALQGTRRVGGLVRFESLTSIAAALVPVAMAVAGFGVVGVFYGQVAASLVVAGVGVVAYARLVRSDPLLPPIGELARRTVRPALDMWRDLRFGLGAAMDKNLASLFSLAPVAILGVVSAEEHVGQLRAALGFMAIPTVLLSPVSRLLMVDVPRLRLTDPGGVAPYFARITRLGLLASVGISAPFAMLAGIGIPVIYGEGYSSAALIAPVLLLDVATVGLGLAAGPIFRAYDRTDLPVWGNSVILLIGVPVGVVLIARWDAWGAALALAIMTVASRLVAYVQCSWLVRA